MQAREPESSSKFVPPPEGLQQAVACDIVDLGLKPNKFNEGKLQHKVRIVFQSENLHPTKNTPLIASQTYTLSLHEKSKLRKDLEAWKGRKLTERERKGFELEDLIGENCQLQIVHNSGTDGETYGNINAIVPLGRGMAKLVVHPEYVRMKDRPGYEFAEPVVADEGAVKVPITGDTKEDIGILAAKLATATGKSVEDVIYDATVFTNDKGEKVGRRSVDQLSEKWAKGTIDRIKKALANQGFIAELAGEPVPF